MISFALLLFGFSSSLSVAIDISPPCSDSVDPEPHHPRWKYAPIPVVGKTLKFHREPGGERLTETEVLATSRKHSVLPPPEYPSAKVWKVTGSIRESFDGKTWSLPVKQVYYVALVPNEGVIQAYSPDGDWEPLFVPPEDGDFYRNPDGGKSRWRYLGEFEYELYDGKQRRREKVFELHSLRGSTSVSSYYAEDGFGPFYTRTIAAGVVREEWFVGEY